MRTMSLREYRYAALPPAERFPESQLPRLSNSPSTDSILPQHFLSTSDFPIASELPSDQKPELKTCPDQASWLSQLHCFTAGTCPTNCPWFDTLSAPGCPKTIWEIPSDCMASTGGGMRG